MVDVGFGVAKVTGDAMVGLAQLKMGRPQAVAGRKALRAAGMERTAGGDSGRAGHLAPDQAPRALPQSRIADRYAV